MPRAVAILISGRGSNMTALIEAAERADFPARITVVISNRADAPGLAKASERGIATRVVESKPYGADRHGFETALQSVLDEYAVELICLGGFMRLFTAPFVERWHGRMLNVHPSLLPSFPGLDPHGQALRAGVKISGATVHFVIPQTDAGPIVVQGAVAVGDDDTVDALAERVLAIEHRIYPEALRLVASGAARLDGDVCKLAGPADLNGTLISPGSLI